MRTKTVIAGASIFILRSTSFWLGSLWRSRSVLTYKVDQIRVNFHTDWPTYGLPLVEYKLILSLLQSGRTNRAIEKAEDFLDVAIYDAKRRRPLLDGRMRDDLDKGLRAAAQYRQQFP